MTVLQRRLSGGLLIVVILLGLELTPVGGVIVRPLSYLTRPLEQSGHNFSQQIKFWLFSKLGGPTAERLADLETTVSQLAVDQARLDYLEVENDKLEQMLELKKNPAWDTVAAAVVGEDPRDSNGLVRLGAGANQGVNRGAAVTSPDGVLVGLVVEVSQDISVARVARSRGTSLLGKINNKADAVGLVESPDGLTLQFSEVPKEVKLAVGDVVVTSLGLAGVPSDIPIGIIASLKGEPADLWQTAILTPFVKLSDLTVVNIVRSTP